MERDQSKQASDSQVSVGTGASVELAGARPTRRRLIVRNNDATNPVYVNSNAAATTSHFLLKAGESIEIRHVGTANAISTGGTVIVSVHDEYD